MVGPEGQERSFDVLRVNYINLDSIKSIIFTVLESGMSQRKTHIKVVLDPMVVKCH